MFTDAISSRLYSLPHGAHVAPTNHARGRDLLGALAFVLTRMCRPKHEQLLPAGGPAER